MRDALAGAKEPLGDLLTRHWATAVGLATRVLTGTETGHWSEVTVTGILRGTAEDTWQRPHVIVLQERGGERRLTIWIGPAEAIAMALALESVETRGPSPPGSRQASSKPRAPRWQRSG